MTVMDTYSQFIHQSRYARWREDLGRRETWEETVDRYIDFMQGQVDKFGGNAKLKHTLQTEVRQAILDQDIMPSMRCMMTAGKALERDNVAGFNCAYVAVDDPRVFDEILYVLMCGTGVGFSVERQFVNQLPAVAEELHNTDTTIKVADSKIGWAKSYRELISLLYSGQIPGWDMSAVRPAGAVLKTFGGRASGPEPLEALFNFTVNVFRKAKGRKLTSLECHDLVCKVAQVVVVGGVRRSALISLSNLSDDRMRTAKNGQWWNDQGQRALANNSAVYAERPQFETFMAEWLSMYESKAGERGIFSRKASQMQAAKSGRRDANHEFGTNPCSEIILRSAQFCNLSEVVIRAGDTAQDLARKVRLATIVGTLQSTLTGFRYLRKIWSKNTEEENLLGVSMTGIFDHDFMCGRLEHMEGLTLKDLLTKLRECAVATNAEWAEELGIQVSTAITCVKPSGTVSQLVNSASGIHPRFSEYYIRRVRGDKKDPLSQFLKEKGVPCEDDVMNSEAYVFAFPQKAPVSGVTVDTVGAFEQLTLWETYQDYWCEHKPSVTIYYSDDEFLGVGQWVWERIEKLSGISFLPRAEHIYQQAPYTACTEEEWAGACLAMPDLSFDDFTGWESSDLTEGAQTLACVSGVCEI